MQKCLHWRCAHSDHDHISPQQGIKCSEIQQSQNSELLLTWLFEHFLKTVWTETRLRTNSYSSASALAVFFSSYHLFCTTRATEGQPYFVFFGFFFCWVCLCLPPSLSQSSPAGFTFSKYHHSSPGRGAGGGWVGEGGGFRQGASNGAECAPHPSFSSPQAAENTGLCHRQQPHSSLTTSTMGLQIYSGEARPTPFSCSLAPSPLSLAPPIQLFFPPACHPLCLALLPYPLPLCLGPSPLPTGASFLLLCSTSPGPVSGLSW